MYADRRFQEDEYFMYIAFSHKQIQDATVQSQLQVKRSDFLSIARDILSTNVNALANLAKQLRERSYSAQKTPEELQCFNILKHIDSMSANIAGSNTSKKYQRNEVRSLILAKGVPTWFITFSPADFKSPICLYYAGENVDLCQLDPLRSITYEKRMRAIASNPVACARFFHLMVDLFIKKILRYGTGKDGLYGRTKEYYGTVESQGRLTLHLHSLIWIAGALGPQEMRDRILDNSSEFQEKLIQYLEGTHTGEFLTGNEADIGRMISEDRLACETANLLGSTVHAVNALASADSSTFWTNPTETLPKALPTFASEKEREQWWSHNRLETDN
jgi:hypothetical protein